MLNLFGGVLLVAVVVVVIFAVTEALNASRTTRLSIAGAAGLWLGLQISLAAQGAFIGEFSRSFPLVGVMVALPPLAAIALAVFSPAARRIMLSLPMPLLIGLNGGRLFGAFFLLLAASGRLGGPFPFYAGWGDVIVGAVGLWICVFVTGGVGEVSSRSLLLFAVAGLIGTVGGRLTRFLAIAKVGAAVSAAVSSLTPLIATFLAILLLGERVTLPILVGTIVITIGTVGCSRRAGSAWAFARG